MPSRQSIYRSIGALAIAAVLWGVVSLSGSFVVTLEVPVRVELPVNRALSTPLPQYLVVTMRASGWSLVKLLSVGRNECVIRPPVTNGSDEQRFVFNGRALLENIRSTDADAQQISVLPDSLTLAVGSLTSKRVPIVPVVLIGTRDGFQVIGGVHLDPDSVTLAGTASALSRVNAWRTQTLSVVEAHAPIRRTLLFSDTLNGIIVPQRNSVVVEADIQEIAEREFRETPVRSRAVSGDTAMRLAVRPAFVTVTVRGGVRDLSRLRAEDISVFLELRAGIDTLGRARPRVELPSGVRLLSSKPEFVRYLWIRGVPKTERATF